MKKKNLLLILLIVISLVVFYGYRALASLREDTKAPEIQMEQQIPQVSVNDPKTAFLQGITARDNIDGDVTDSLVIESIELLDGDGRLMIGYAAFDSAGNVAKAEREAKYTDYESPRFTLKRPLLYTYGSTFDVLDNVGAQDVIDGEIQHRVRATSLVEHSINQFGVHDIQFQVTNSLGDTVTKVFPVEVYDPKDYDAYLQLTDYLVYLPLNTPFQAASYLSAFLYQEDVSLTQGLPAGYSLKTEGTVQNQNPGVYPVEYRVTYTIENERDPELNQEIVAYSKLIVIVEG